MDNIGFQLQVDKDIALLLEKGLSGVKSEVLKQAGMIEGGFTRLTWYSSCFLDHYQDVCQNLKKEDLRFIKSITAMAHHRDIIYALIRPYIDKLLSDIGSDRISDIQKFLLRNGADFSSATLTNQFFANSFTIAICSAIGLRFTLSSTISRYSGFGVGMLGLYGRVHKAAEAANRLKHFNHFYYAALYRENLEMLYFLVEPVMQKNYHFLPLWASDQEVAAAILRLME